MEITADTFKDYFIYIDHVIVLRAGEPGEAVFRTRAFRIEFTGPYAYLRMVEGMIVAHQGQITDAVAVLS